MKKYLLFALAAASMGLVSCSEDCDVMNDANTVDAQQIATSSVNFKVLEEWEVSGQELLDNTLAGLDELAGTEAYEDLKVAFEMADEKLLTEDAATRAIVPALYKAVRLEYQTTDQDMKPVTASALVVYPLLKKMDKVMLINHGTHIGAMMVPTQYTSVEAIMAATGALCVMPDYIGLGSSSDHPDLYLNHEVHGRTSVDALMALLDYAKSKRLSLKSNYSTYICGYSQGGSVSLASLREVQRRDAATQKRINLKQVYCGDGPYDLRRTFETYVEDYQQGKEMGMGAVIPLVINSMFNSYPQEMAQFNYEDYFTAEALATGLPQAIRANEEDAIDMVTAFNGQMLNQILNFDYLDAYPEAYTQLLAMMDRSNLCQGWTPTYPLKLLHCNPDGVVPFSNFENAVAGLQNSYMETKVVDIDTNVISSAMLQHVYGMLVMTAEILAK